MPQQAGYSPSFKRPAEVLRMRRRRSGLGGSSRPTESSGLNGSSTACPRPFSPGPLSFQRNPPTRRGAKRRNPFANLGSPRSPKKNRVAEADGARDEESSLRDCLQLLDSNEGSLEQGPGPQDLHEGSLEQGPGPQDLHEGSLEQGPGPQDLHEGPLEQGPGPQDLHDWSLEADHQDPGPQENIHGTNPGCDAASSRSEYPADWSLKTRLLFTSPHSLSWAEQPRAQEEALGLHQHCRARFSPLPRSLSDPRSCSELRAAFQQALVYWQHPSLPWLSMFPRINAEKSFGGQNRPWAQDGAVQQSLRREWSLSLSSLYSLLKSRLCPYFYLCSYQFTVLFRAAGLGGSSSITALISPTTRGLREAMKAEGIEFSVPLVEERSKRRREREEQEDRQKENRAVSLDHKPESVALVDGHHTFTLINFLINSKSLVAAAGSQAGLPPTLLSPVAFRGASMHLLKSRCVNVKSQVEFSYQNISSLEITGPVLPSSLHTITKLLQRSQKGEFWSVLSTHRPTAVLNTAGTQLQGGPAPRPEDLSSCGLHPDSVQQLLQPSSLGKTALTHIKMSQNRYSWKN
ncbi:protein downstream neighbor of son homolog isoform X2 [Salarias fasciatus]|uniref:protein downstream neighbor of son homolog isoform X2 n=1 Tax=Salarias fasciatus TaxID=181472 RepID=UPI001176860E|nr:protein downstream neighbor of Son isoform X2 [Salarias fasciatus]